jgi:REP element-mobilizing transposase RayT
MPRRPRRMFPGRVYHLISRFVDREWFISSNVERTTYLGLLSHALSECDWRCLAYAVMSNHIHLCLVAGQQRLASWIRRVHSPFADWMNRTHERIGSIFVRGPKDIEVPPERVRDVIAYIHNNPVRAGVVGAAADSSWTSHRSYLGLEPVPRWLHVQAGLALGGFAAGAALDAWVATAPDAEWDAVVRASDDPVPRQTTAAKASIIVQAAAEEVGLPLAELQSPRRSQPALLGREVAVRCASAVGVTGKAIADALQMSQQGASRIGQRSVSPRVMWLVSRVLGRFSDAEVVEVVSDPL